MVVGIIGIIIGLMVLAAGIYYLVKEKDDKDSKKIYGITSLVGMIVSIVSVVIVITNC